MLPDDKSQYGDHICADIYVPYELMCSNCYARTAPSRDPGVPGQCLSFPLYSSEIKADKMSAVVPRYPVLESRFRLRFLTGLAAGRWSSHNYLITLFFLYGSFLPEFIAVALNRQPVA